MKIFSRLIVALLGATAFFSCHKEPPVAVSTPPVFHMDATIGGNPVHLAAGENNYYMYSYFGQDANNIFNFGGFLSVYNCTNCGNYFQVQINDFAPSAVNGNAQISTSLAPGYFAYHIPGGTPTEFNVSFTSGGQGTPSAWLWDFGDGGISTQQNPTHTYLRPGVYSVTESATFGSSVLTNAYKIRFGTPESNIVGTFTGSANGNTISFSPTIAGGTPPYTYSWDFGDGNYSTAVNPVHTYASTGLYVASMHVTDNAGNVLDFCSNTATQTYTPPYTNFLVTLPPTTNPNPNGLSNVYITWIDAAGTTYRSDNSAQPSSSYFQIISTDDYSLNDHNQATKKLHIKFRCKVYSATDSLQIDNGDAVIAVAYQ